MTTPPLNPPKTPASPPDLTEQPEPLNQLFDQLHASPYLRDAQRQLLRQRIDQVLHYHAKIGILGKTGSGKSTLCNALFGANVAAVSAVESCTREPQDIDLALNHGKGITLIDMPGLGEDDERDAEYGYLYTRMLPELDLVLWLIKGDDRALAPDLHWHDTVVQPYCQQHDIPLLFVINQIDKIEPATEWDRPQCQPGQQQARNIARKLDHIAALFDLPPSRLCAISAAHNYGLIELVEKIVRALPDAKKWGFTREARPQNISLRTRQDSEQGLWATIKATVMEIVKDGAEFVIGKLACMGRRLFCRF